MYGHHQHADRDARHGAPKPSSPPPRSARSRLSQAKLSSPQAFPNPASPRRRVEIPPASLGYSAVFSSSPGSQSPSQYLAGTFEGQPLTSSSDAFSPSIRAKMAGSPSHQSASSSLMAELRPSTPPRHSARSRLHHTHSTKVTSIQSRQPTFQYPDISTSDAQTSTIQQSGLSPMEHSADQCGFNTSAADFTPPPRRIWGDDSSPNLKEFLTESRQNSIHPTNQQFVSPQETDLLRHYDTHIQTPDTITKEQLGKTCNSNNSAVDFTTGGSLSSTSLPSKYTRTEAATTAVHFRDRESVISEAAYNARFSYLSDVEVSPGQFSDSGGRASLLSKVGSRRSSRKSILPNGHHVSALKRTSVEVEDPLISDTISRLSVCSTLAGTDDVLDNADSSESEIEELLEDPPAPNNLAARRASVSAEAHGAFNQIRLNVSLPKHDKPRAQMQSLRDALRECPFFSNLDDDVLDQLVEYVPIDTYQPGACVFRQGDQGDSACVILSGSVEVYKADLDSIWQRSKGDFIRRMSEGRVFGEISMLWRTPRSRSVYAAQDGPVLLGTISREVFHNLGVRSQMVKRERREECLRRSAMLETLSDEQIAQIADALETRFYQAGDVIVRQGETGDEFYVIMAGTCVVTVETGNDKNNIDVQEHRRCHAGDLFGERALLHNTVRTATVSAHTDVEVLCLRRRKFERMLGPLDQLQRMHYLADPRTNIAKFWGPGDKRGPCGVLLANQQEIDPREDARTYWFAVYRPTSRDAIAKMLSGAAVGKGLNVKGKSAKKSHLSGFVPFLQISNENHKNDVEESPSHSRVQVFFHTESNCQTVLAKLEPLLHLPELDIEDRQINLLRYMPGLVGLDLPEPVLREAFIMRPDISAPVGWETGRESEPAFMDMNLHAIRDHTEPKVVLLQFDQDNPMNPHGLLIAYAEANVKPVVSDFDTFTVGSLGMPYSTIPPEQAELATWALDHTHTILRRKSRASWVSRWLEVMKEAHEKGFHPAMPKYGFGDATSYALTEAIVQATIDSGAIRHGAECFNYYFPQELDEEFLVVWNGFPDKPWAYMDQDDMRDFLLVRAREGFCMPLNPVWLVRDEGFYDIFETLRENPASAPILNAWYPPGSGIIERIEDIHREFPAGFEIDADAPVGPDNRIFRSPSQFGDLDLCERAALARNMARKSRGWSLARATVRGVTALKRASIFGADSKRSSDLSLAGPQRSGSS